MESYCIIPNSNDGFWELLQELNIDTQYKDILCKSSIMKIEVNPETRSWDLFLRLAEPVPQEIFNRMSQNLCEHCGLQKVNFNLDSINLKEYLQKHWMELISNITDKNPAAYHILKNAKWRLNNNKLLIETAGEIATIFLKSKKMDSQLQEYIQNIFLQSITVQFCALDVNNECESDIIEDYKTPEYLDALKESLAGYEKNSNQSENQSVFGRNIKGEAECIHNFQEECRGAVMEGEILSFELKKLKSGRFLLTFDVADETDGISGKTFFDEESQAQKVEKLIKKGLWVKVKGTVQYDKFVKELVLFADSMQIIKTAEITDNAEVKRVELHAHTQMSNLDAVVSVKNLINTAAKWGHPAIAITDHGVVQAFPEAQEVAEKAGIKVIYGMEGYLFEQDIKQSRHVIILARNKIGLQNLYRIVSLSHLQFLYKRPRIPKYILSELREGLLIGSACEAGELIQAIINGASDEELLKIASFYDYLEIQPIGNNEFLLREGIIENEDGLKQINLKIVDLARKLNKLVVATCDVHFLRPEDSIYRKILMTGQGYKDADNQPPIFLRTTEEMLGEFDYLGKQTAYEVVVENPRKISDLIEMIKPIPDELYSPEIPGAEEQIESMSYQKAEEIYGSPLPDIVSARLKQELDSIINNGFAVLYLIAHKLVKKSTDDGYLVGSRGSVGSSLVAYMTGITEVNSLPPHWVCPNCKNSEFVIDGSYGCGFDLPNKHCSKCKTMMKKDGHDIPFATFLGFHGDKVPDIDLNFSGDYQPVAHKYTEELFGRDNVFRAGTIATVAEKTAYGYVKNYFDDKGIVARNARMEKLLKGCTGVKRTTGQHPGGIMVVPRDMDVHHFSPIQYPADDKNSSTITTHFDYHSISSRLVKLDILGHDDPTVIKMLEDLTNTDPKKVPFDDPETMSIFSTTTALGLTPEEINSTVATYGIPEFGTKFVRQMLDDTKPKTFNELVRISGFSHGTDVWLNNAQDLIKNGTAKLSEAISARDDIMVYLMHKELEPVDAFKIMEGVRKGKGITPENETKMRAKSVPEWYIQSCQKIKYMFPKAHAVAYVMMAFRIAFYKVHYPLAFYAAYFTVRGDEFDADLICKGLNVMKSKLSELEEKGKDASVKEKGLQTILEIAIEMCLRGFCFYKVDLYRSHATKFLIVDNGLLPPLASLEGVGEAAAKSIMEVRKEKPFSSIEDIRVRSHVSKTVLDILKAHGSLRDLPETDQITLFA